MDKYIKKALGMKIKYYRNQANITRKELSELTNIPLTSLSNYERGDREPSLNILDKIATALGVTLKDMVNFDITYGQKAIYRVISDEYTLESLSKDSEIDISELNNILENNDLIDADMYIKLFKFLKISDNKHDILSMRANDYYKSLLLSNDNLNGELKDSFNSNNLDINKLNNLFIKHIEDEHVQNFISDTKENNSNYKNFNLFLFNKQLNNFLLDIEDDSLRKLLLNLYDMDFKINDYSSLILNELLNILGIKNRIDNKYELHELLSNLKLFIEFLEFKNSKNN